MPDKISRGDGLIQESFLVDLMSLAGHSGSPVFIYEIPNHLPGDKDFRFLGVRLLGINWGYYRRVEKVLKGIGEHPEVTDLWM